MPVHTQANVRAACAHTARHHAVLYGNCCAVLHAKCCAVLYGKCQGCSVFRGDMARALHAKPLLPTAIMYYRVVMVALGTLKQEVKASDVFRGHQDRVWQTDQREVRWMRTTNQQQPNAQVCLICRLAHSACDGTTCAACRDPHVAGRAPNSPI